MPKPCPVCGKPIDIAGMRRHIRSMHPEFADVPLDEIAEAMSQEPQEFSQDEPPRPRKTAGAKKQAAPKRAAPKVQGLPLAQQLAFPYEIASNLLAPRLPQTSMVLHAQAPVCGQAWDQFLMRFPALREKIEQGMIATDVVALIMAHVPIFQVMRAESAAITQAAQHYEGGIPTPAAA